MVTVTKIRKNKYRIQEIAAVSLAAHAVSGTNMTVFRIGRFLTEHPSYEIFILAGHYKTYDDALKEVVKLIKEDDERIETGMVKNVWEVS